MKELTKLMLEKHKLESANKKLTDTLEAGHKSINDVIHLMRSGALSPHEVRARLAKISRKLKDHDDTII